MSRNYSLERIADLHRNGQLDVLGEVTTQYEGIEPSDPGSNPIGRWPSGLRSRSGSTSARARSE